MNSDSNNNQVVQFNFFDAAQFEVMQRVSTMFANSEIVPDMYRITDKNPKEKAIANCMIAIETAQRIGASPLMVMQNMNIIYGRPSWSAKFLTATVNSCGRFETLQYRWANLGSCKGTEYTEYKWNNDLKKKLPVTQIFQDDVPNWQCVAYTTKKGDDKLLESIEVDVAMAMKEGWFTKDGSKWKTMAKLMLQYRCVSFWTNAYAPELSMGMKTSEEILDFEDIPHDVVSTTVKDEIKTKANTNEMKMDEPPPVVEDPEENKNQDQSQDQPAGNSTERNPI